MSTPEEPESPAPAPVGGPAQAPNEPAQAQKQPEPPQGPPPPAAPYGSPPAHSPYGPPPPAPLGQPAPTRPLIVNQVPMRGTSKIPIVANRALIFSDKFGGIERLSSYPGLLEARRYQMRYEVDLSRRSSSWECEVPSRNPTAPFVVKLTVSWGVTDPVAVVQWEITDGLEIIKPRLEETARGYGHSYPVTQYIDFEQHLSRVLAGQPSYEEGVGVFRCTVQVSPDRRYLEHEIAIAEEEHKARLLEVQGRWVDFIDSELDLLKEHLKGNRDDIPSALAEMRKRAEEGNARDTQRYKDLLDSDLVTNMDDLQDGLNIIKSDTGGAAGPLPLLAPEAIAIPAPVADESIEDAEVIQEEPDADPRTYQAKEGRVDGWVKAPWAKSDD